MHIPPPPVRGPQVAVAAKSVASWLLLHTVHAKSLKPPRRAAVLCEGLNVPGRVGIAPDAPRAEPSVYPHLLKDVAKIRVRVISSA